MAALDQAITVVFLVAHLVWWPLEKLLHVLVALVSPFYRIAVFLVLPLLHAATTAITILSLPFTVKWLERIETLYVYLGTAALIGCITGGVVYTLFRILSSTFHMDAAVVQAPPKKQRTTAEYRASKVAHKPALLLPHGPVIRPDIVKKVPEFRLQKGLLSSAVIEEEDSDF